MASPHEIKVFRALQNHKGDWMTRADIERAANVNGRTTRAHLLKLEKSGVVQRAEMFPSDQYRLISKPSLAGRAHTAELENAGKILGI